jgi:hypothetical protein
LESVAGEGSSFRETKSEHMILNTGLRMLKNYGLRISVYLVAAGLAAASLRWSQATNLATILLLLVTFEYVLLTHNNLELFRYQLQRQENAYVYFDVICRDGVGYVRVTNLGISNFLVTGMKVRTQDFANFSA